MRKVLAILGLLCALPLFASAQAGFPNKPLWLSNTKPAAGEEISIYTVLYNGTDVTVNGAVTFSIDDKNLAPQSVSLTPQSSTVVSAKWVAKAGTHTFAALFGSSAAESSQETSAVAITVAEPPPPPPPTALQENVDKAKEVAGSIASSSAPFVQKVAQAVFTQTENLRETGIEYLEKKVDPPSPKKTATGSTANTTGFASTSSSSPQASGSTLHNIGQVALAASLFTLRSFYLFYPLLALLFFLALYYAYKKLRRPHS